MGALLVIPANPCGNGLLRFCKRSELSSPLISRSFWPCASAGRLRKASSAPATNRSRQSRTSATVQPSVRAASTTDVSRRRVSSTRDVRRMAVQRFASGACPAGISSTSTSNSTVLTVVSLVRGAVYVHASQVQPNAKGEQGCMVYRMVADTASRAVRSAASARPSSPTSWRRPFSRSGAATGWMGSSSPPASSPTPMS